MKYFYSTAGMTDASIICFLPLFFESSNAISFYQKIMFVLRLWKKGQPA